MSSTTRTSDDAEHSRYLESVRAQHLGALWSYGRELLPPEPMSHVEPRIWHYTDVRATLLDAGSVISPEEAERRVLLFLNPGLLPTVGTTRTLLAALQLLLPGEIARAHRHSPAALRFIVEGEGAHTTVDGERTTMAPGDLVLTPSFAWHDHESTGDSPVIWFDGLDLPLVTALEAMFFELHGDGVQPLTEPVDASKSRSRHGTLRPAGARTATPHSPVVNYPWDTTERALAAAAQVHPATPMISLNYINPDDGGPVMPTISAGVHRLAPGANATVGRRMASSIVHVVRGDGTSLVGDTELTWSEHDVIACPPWVTIEHQNASDSEPAILFSISDEPVMRALHLYREG